MGYTDEDIEFANLILTDRGNLDDAKVERSGTRDVAEGICHGLSEADEYRF